MWSDKGQPLPVGFYKHQLKRAFLTSESKLLNVLFKIQIQKKKNGFEKPCFKNVNKRNNRILLGLQPLFKNTNYVPNTEKSQIYLDFIKMENCIDTLNKYIQKYVQMHLLNSYFHLQLQVNKTLLIG